MGQTIITYQNTLDLKEDQQISAVGVLHSPNAGGGRYWLIDVEFTAGREAVAKTEKEKEEAAKEKKADTAKPAHEITADFLPHKPGTTRYYDTHGKRYTIDLVSRDFDAYLRLEDSTGKQLAEDDDSGGNLNARIVFQAPKDDTYWIIATTFLGGTGNYTLSIREGGVANDKGAGKKVFGARRLEARVKTVSKDNLDQMFTQHLRNLSVSATKKQIIIDFDVDSKNWQPVTKSLFLIVRLFDKEGQYLTHFVSRESFTASPDVHAGWMTVVNRFKGLTPEVRDQMIGDFTPKLLESTGNRLVYNVNPAILENAAIVEIGLLHVPKKGVAQRLVVLFCKMIAAVFMTILVDQQAVHFFGDPLVEPGVSQAEQIEVQITTRRITGQEVVRSVDKSDGHPHVHQFLAEENGVVSDRFHPRCPFFRRNDGDILGILFLAVRFR